MGHFSAILLVLWERGHEKCMKIVKSIVAKLQHVNRYLLKVFSCCVSTELKSGISVMGAGTCNIAVMIIILSIDFGMKMLRNTKKILSSKILLLSHEVLRPL